MECLPHTGNVYTLLRTGISPGTITSNQPAAEAGRNHRALTDQGFNDFFPIPNFAGHTGRQHNALESSFEQHYLATLIQVAGISRARQYRLVRELTETEVNQSLCFRRSLTFFQLKIQNEMFFLAPTELAEYKVSQIPLNHPYVFEQCSPSSQMIPSQCQRNSERL